MRNYGFIKVATVSPKTISIANPRENSTIMLNYLKQIQVENPNTQVIVFPELSLTGYTCGDLFNNQLLIDESLNELKMFATLSKDYTKAVILVGVPIRKDNQLFNCAAIIKDGNILGFIPKTYLPNYSVFYEMRNFRSSKNRLDDVYYLDGKEIPFTTDILIKDISSSVVISGEICEDMWTVIPMSSIHCLNGANLIVNLSASNEIIGKAKFREDLIKMHTATSVCSYVYVSSGKDESTTDNVFSGHSIIAENGRIIKESKFPESKEIVYADIDIEKCMNDRSVNISYMEFPRDDFKKNYKTINVDLNFNESKELDIDVPLYPFVPKEMNSRAEEILNIQAAGLAQRLKKINVKKVVIGISGGLDSTLALLVALEAFRINNYDKKDIIGITMPCFGTSNRTLNNSNKLMTALGITQYEIDIKAACIQHLKDINHDENLLDITYENTQARERTQILMDMSNKHNALVVGTGDLSELALGWCTYNGDHMSMYGVNASIPKTLVRYLVKYYADFKVETEAKDILTDILNTPVSPELLPPKADGTIAQITENSIGSYVTHDFILYYMLRYNFAPSKIFKLYEIALNQYNKENKIEENLDFNRILKDFNTFYNRFFTQQFKRNCLPDGVKVGSISLSPRGDWKMPSDASRNLWLMDLNKIKL